MLLKVVGKPETPFQATYRGKVVTAVRHYVGTADGNERVKRLTAVGAVISQLGTDRNLSGEVISTATKMARGY